MKIRGGFIVGVVIITIGMFALVQIAEATEITAESCSPVHVQTAR